MCGMEKKKKHNTEEIKTQESHSREGEAAGSAVTTDLPHTECESLKACVPHQLLGPLPNPCMRLDLNYDGEWWVKYRFTWR